MAMPHWQRAAVTVNPSTNPKVKPGAKLECGCPGELPQTQTLRFSNVTASGWHWRRRDVSRGGCRRPSRRGAAPGTWHCSVLGDAGVGGPSSPGGRYHGTGGDGGWSGPGPSPSTVRVLGSEPEPGHEVPPPKARWVFGSRPRACAAAARAAE